MDIGSKIKQARAEAKITQEQAAEALGISRQTLSNWENEKFYPDIASVIRMSDLYNVSLGDLLKGGASAKRYLNYIEESTNTVKSKTRLSKLIVLLSYLVIWAFNILVSWWFVTGRIHEALAGGFQFLVLPVVTIVISCFIGFHDYWGRRKWFAPICFGLMFALSVYAGYALRASSPFDSFSLQTLTLVFIGAMASLLGMALGHVFSLEQKRMRAFDRFLQKELEQEHPKDAE